MNIDIPLTKPQMEFALHSSNHPALVGGLGCMRGDTRIVTEFGLMRICDITSSIRVLSWNEKNQKFQLSLSGGSFPKGRANLYRVLTTQGEFAASEHHRIFSSGRKYQQVRNLRDGDQLPCYGSLSHSKMELDQLLCSLDVQRYSKTDEDYLARCADEARQYGQQLLTEEENALFYPPSKGGAHILSHNGGSCASSDKGDLEAHSPTHSRPYQFDDQTCTKGYSPRHEGPEPIEVNHTLTSPSEHTSHYHQQAQQSHERLKYHHNTEQHSFDVHSFVNAFYSSTTEASILSVNQLEVSEPYFDMQVLGTNNYICENGLIHHNSGKTEAGIARMVLLMLENYSNLQKPCNTLMTQPTYDLLKLRSIPGTEDFLDRIGIAYKTNKSDYHIDIPPYGRILFRSYDRPERIVSFECAHSLTDELDTLPLVKAEFVWRKISERTREKSFRPNSIACVTTPDQGLTGFVYKKWVKKRQNGYVLIKAPTASNPYLPDGYIDQIRANYDPLLAECYLMGEFVSLNDKKVYHFFNREKHHIDREIKDNDRLYIGIDFNVGGCCATVWVIDGKKPIAVDEFISHDTQDFVNNLSKYKNQIMVYPDASGGNQSSNASATDIDIIENAGYAVDSPNKNPFVRDRINCMNALLAHERIGVNCEKCPELTNALETQGYTDKNEPEKFNEHPAIDDWVDGAGYFIHRRFEIMPPAAHVGYN